MRIAFLFTWALSFLVTLSVCHSEEDHSEHDHSHHGGLEIGISLEYTYLDEEVDEHEEEEHDPDRHNGSESALGLHLHLVRALSENGHQRHFGVGIGGEIILAEDPHYGLMGSLAIYPRDELTLMVSPGIEIAKHDGSHDTEFAMHYEATYGFWFSGLHLGPVIGFSHTADAEHYSAGIHLGF